jgi:hypothetical protein
VLAQDMEGPPLQEREQVLRLAAIGQRLSVLPKDNTANPELAKQLQTELYQLAIGMSARLVCSHAFAPLYNNFELRILNINSWTREDNLVSPGAIPALASEWR